MAGIGKLFKKGKRPPEPPRKDYENRSRSQDGDSDEDSYLDPTTFHPTFPPSSSSGSAQMPTYPPPRPHHSPISSQRNCDGNSTKSSYSSEETQKPPVKPRTIRNTGRGDPKKALDDYSDPWDATRSQSNNDDYCEPVDMPISTDPYKKNTSTGKLDDYSDPWDSTQLRNPAPKPKRTGVRDEYIDPWDAKDPKTTNAPKDSDDDESYSEPYDTGKVTALDEQAKRMSLRGMKLPSQSEHGYTEIMSKQPQSPTADNRPCDDYDSPWESKGLILPLQSNMMSTYHDKNQAPTADSRHVDDYDKPWEWTARKAQQFGIPGTQPKPQSLPQAPKVDLRPADDYDAPWETNKRTSQLVSMIQGQGQPNVDFYPCHQGPKPPVAEKGSMTVPAGPPKPIRTFAESGEETNEPFSVDSTIPLVKQKWYHGPITRVEAERMLKHEEDCSFLVRDSESSKRDYSLSLKNNNTFMHLKIAITPQGKYVLGQFSKPFDVVPEVVHHYSVNKLNIKGAEHKYLKYPVCPHHEYFVLEKS